MNNNIFNNNCEGFVKNCKISITKTVKNNPNLKIIIYKNENILTKGLWIDDLKQILITRKILFSILKLNKIKHSKNIKLYKLFNLINNLHKVEIEIFKPNNRTYLEIKY